MAKPVGKVKKDAAGTVALGELAVVEEITGILAAGGRQRQTLAEVVAVLRDKLGMRRVVVIVTKPGTDELTVEAADRLTARQCKGLLYRKGHGVVGRSVQSGRTVLLRRTGQDPLLLDRPDGAAAASDEVTFFCVPICIGREVVGALVASRPFDESADTDGQLGLLSAVAGIIAADMRRRRELAAERDLLRRENVRLRGELEDRFRPENIVGSSGAMREVYRAIRQVAASDTTVLIRGESGTGKELVAHAIHVASPRAAGPFVKVNCAALSEGLLTSELFGDEKGAFTGAIQARKGRIEEADGGTLFLDEIGDFSPATQVKLLRVLQDRQFERVGSNETRKANVRIICATNRNLEKAVEAGEFRPDLYYRINVFPIFLPPLRERKDDILLLADHFVERYSNRMGKDVRRISTPAINMMVAYHWPGNVRELENCIERAVLLSSDGVIHGHHLPPTLQTSDFCDTVGAGTLSERVALFERDIIVDALKRTDGNASAAARDLGTTARILRYKMKRLGVDYRAFRAAR